MSEWTDGYRAALADIVTIFRSRGILTGDDHAQAIRDLESDALVIEREHHNRLRRIKLRIEREALPLFDKDNAP